MLVLLDIFPFEIAAATALIPKSQRLEERVSG
jgi:hypothetical protein